METAMKRLVLLSAWTLLLPMSSYASTWQVPSQCPTIQAGIDSAGAGDTVLVACGTYYENTITLKSGVSLRSETGEANCVTVDAQGHGRVFFCQDVDSTAAIWGITITGGFYDLGGGIWCSSSGVKISDCLFHQNQAYHGGGMTCWSSSPTLTNCTFSQNTGEFGPAGLYCKDSSPTLVDCSFIDNGKGAMHCSSSSPVLIRCIFLENFSYEPGGGLLLYNSSPTLTNCTFSENEAFLGGAAIYLVSDNTLLLENTIIAFSSLGEAVLCDDESSDVVLTCCDVYGNAGGDWVGCIADQFGVNGNFSEDPLFCDPENGDYRLHCHSTCAPGNHPDGYPCGLVGALATGCGDSAGAQTTWSSLKALYR